ncbi:hypothetical protein [Rudanella lutea]|uniref:hypothetical protein n=1 Tax=Rudanella lutea TaxID=451374 RepID=UPI0012F84B30|nr:hypothetical protein [Rudanella lutea]
MQIIYTKIARAFLVGLALVMGITTSFGKANECTGTGHFDDGTLAGVAIIKWVVEDTDCCARTSGLALVTYAYYINGVYSSTVSYYVTIAEVQYAAGCNSSINPS